MDETILYPELFRGKSPYLESVLQVNYVETDVYGSYH